MSFTHCERCNTPRTEEIPLQWVTIETLHKKVVARFCCDCVEKLLEFLEAKCPMD